MSKENDVDCSSSRNSCLRVLDWDTKLQSVGLLRYFLHVDVLAGNNSRNNHWTIDITHSPYVNTQLSVAYIDKYVEIQSIYSVI